jgi:hypothetical protein
MRKGQKQGMGMSLQITQKPQLLRCNTCCEDCYNNGLYPNGFYCPDFKIVNISALQILRRKNTLKPKYPGDITLSS